MIHAAQGAPDAFAALEVAGIDGHRWQLLALAPPQATAHLLWLPAMGVAARNYLPFAQALYARGIAVFVHDWRGNGSSSLRPSPTADWGYRELLESDLPATVAAMQAHPGATAGNAIVGGHSLGGQLAACFLGQQPRLASQLWLVASGAPYWRAFPPRTRWWLPLAYRFLPWLARRLGYLPGRRIGFGGNESRSLIDDWSRTALAGRYAASGVEADLEAGMAQLDVVVRAVVLERDWLAPTSSLRFLLSKMPRSKRRVRVVDATTLGAKADHFHWMKHPGPVASALLADE